MATLATRAVADRRQHAAWFAAVGSCLLLCGMFLAALPARWDQLASLRDLPTGISADELRANLAASRMSVDLYAGYVITTQAAYAAVCITLAAAMLWRPTRSAMTLYVAVLLVLLGTTFWGTVGALVAYAPVWGYVGYGLAAASKLGLLVLLLVFPDGRFVPRWTRWVAVVLAVGLPVDTALGDSAYSVGNWPVPLFLLFLALILGGGIAAQLHRYRHVSGPEERVQAKWVVAGVVGAITGFIGTVLLVEVVFAVAGPGTPGELVAMTAVTLSLLMVPVSIAIAVLRHRLFDIDLIINRALVWTALTVGVVAGYVLVVGWLGSLFRGDADLPVSLAAAGLVAVAFAPLRERVQRGVNHVMYGGRDDPYAVLSRLGERLEASQAPQDVLPVAVTTVAEALRVPYVAVEVDSPTGPRTLAATGEPVAEPVVLPLAYAGEPVGRLLLARRRGESEFSPADLRLLDGLVRQVGVAAHAVGLAADLQHSRERLVTAREEERRRLRRDLHDGLGPQLASLTLQVEAARDLLATEPIRAGELLGSVVHQAHEAVGDVRRVVDELRPPAIDALGLVGALRSATSHHEAGGLVVDLHAPELPALPAAVEVAAYRIAMEAVTNVARHAAAARCRLSIGLRAGELVVEVADDGRGLPPLGSRGTGVGLSSMRERAEELGGRLVIDSAGAGGACVTAHLPLGGPS